MKNTFILLICSFFLTFVFINNAQASKTEWEEITSTIQRYVTGTSFNNQQNIKDAFAPEALLLLDKEEMDFWPVTVNEYASWFSKSKEGQFNGRIGNILAIDYDGEIATAKVEILIPKKAFVT